MSVLEYASKFNELSRFAPAYVANQKLKMNCYETRLNPNLKERMSVHQYTSYKDMYDTTVNMERMIKEKNEFYIDQRGKKRKGASEKSTLSKSV